VYLLYEEFCGMLGSRKRRPPWQGSRTTAVASSSSTTTLEGDSSQLPAVESRYTIHSLRCLLISSQTSDYASVVAYVVVLYFMSLCAART